MRLIFEGRAVTGFILDRDCVGFLVFIDRRVISLLAGLLRDIPEAMGTWYILFRILGLLDNHFWSEKTAFDHFLSYRWELNILLSIQSHQHGRSSKHEEFSLASQEEVRRTRQASRGKVHAACNSRPTNCRCSQASWELCSPLKVISYAYHDTRD